MIVLILSGLCFLLDNNFADMIGIVLFASVVLN